MSAKYNWVIDNFAVRMALHMVAFAVWAGVAYGLLSLA